MHRIDASAERRSTHANQSPNARQQHGSDELSTAQLEMLRQRLLAQREELLDKRSRALAELRHSERASDEHDQATLAENHWLAAQLRNHVNEVLVEIDAALARIRRGDYGYCEQTGEPIGIERLLARPTATLSVEAQDRQERLARLCGALN